MMGPDDLSGQPVIIGGGLAGLMTALRLAPKPVVLLSKGPPGNEASSVLAQGGIAVSCGDDDSPMLHLADTLAAGNGLCDLDVARRITDAGLPVIEELIGCGVQFDRGADGYLLRGLEAAHCRRRIIHAGGDGTGREIMRALVEKVRQTSSITLLEEVEARRLYVEGGTLTGVLVVGKSGHSIISTGHVVIATGGIGGLFNEATNPVGCFGHGLALAARAGAVLADLEFIQFHPTALDNGMRPMALLSETVRGEGAILIDETGYRFMAEEAGAELAARDIVARAVWRHMTKGHQVFVDARHALGDTFSDRFPGIASVCLASGINPGKMPIPIRPAAHYHMGGIAVNDSGQTSVPGLWACGEAACTGLHGANRLASNSLLEAAASAVWVAESVASSEQKNSNASTRFSVDVKSLPATPDPSPIRSIVSSALGVLRDRDELVEAILRLLPIAEEDSAASDPAIVGLMLAVSALRREESRGAHYRTDFPQVGAVAERSHIQLQQALAVAHELASLSSLPSFSSERLR